VGLFNETVETAHARGYLSGEHFSVDDFNSLLALPSLLFKRGNIAAAILPCIKSHRNPKLHARHRINGLAIRQHKSFFNKHASHILFVIEKRHDYLPKAKRHNRKKQMDGRNTNLTPNERNPPSEE
jgi:hypothetical protein